MSTAFATQTLTLNCYEISDTDRELVRIDVQMLEEPAGSVSIRCKNPEVVLKLLSTTLESIFEKTKDNPCPGTKIDTKNFAAVLWSLLGQIDKNETYILNALEDLAMLYRDNPETFKARVEFIRRTKRVLPSWESKSPRLQHRSEEELFSDLINRKKQQQTDLKTLLLDAATKQQKRLLAKMVCDAILMGHDIQREYGV